MTAKVLLIELNEFNRELLEQAAYELNLPHIQKILHWYRSDTLTQDTYESDFLEPWVQWVCVHTGLPSSQHHIKHLGDIPNLQTEQLWQHLSKKGFTSGIWGAMNANRADSPLNQFFLPDPWTASEHAYPAELNAILTPLRYFSQNYTNRSWKASFQAFKELIRFLKKHRIPFMQEIPALLKNAIRFKAKAFVFISFIEYLSTLLFLKYRQRYQPDFSLIFLNSLAHLQHHHWKADRISEPLAYGFRYLDRMMGHLLAEEGIILMTNALSQKNTNEEKPWILYRQIDQAHFLKTIGVQCERVEPLMTHDALLFFASAQLCQQAKQTLESANLCGQKLFLVESYPQDPQKLFYRILFTDEVPDHQTFIVQGQHYPFFKLFKPIVRRTGKHIPQGTLYCNIQKIPPVLKNHEIFKEISAFFHNS
ncbi:MAG: hypothetical protein JSS62_04895 [Verrucomicrobia bacterium]|nr:hypothetical protein [Verrucomicrobiota bacterium]MBS0646744.1 hypothetical protein [Verrucomicrobiota bacterium]